MPIDPAAPRPDERPAGRGRPAGRRRPAGEETASSGDEHPPWWQPVEPDAPSEAAPARSERLLGWLRPTPAELVGLVLLLLGSVVATVVWWGQSVTGPASIDQVRAVGTEVPAISDAGEAPAGDGEAVADAGAVGPVAGDDAAGSGSGTAVTVHVSGAVTHPGLVTLPTGGRVGDAVVAAGGLTGDADTARVNLARALVDGEQVHLPRVGEDPPEPVAPAGTSLPETGAPSGATADAPLDLNRASAAELDELPGIGPSRAAAIVEHRERHGPFAVPGDLRAVPGIGEVTFQNLAPLVVVR
jgi:competence protein ComEA